VKVVNDPGKVTISGTNGVDESLQASVSDDGLTGVTISYQWLADGNIIQGATEQALHLTSGFVTDYADKALSVRASYTDVWGNVETPVSAVVAVPKVLQSGVDETVTLSTANTSHKLVGFEAWNGSAGDKLSLANLLTGYDPQTSLLANWVSKTTSTVSDSTSTTLVIDLDGPGAGTTTHTVVLQDVDWSNQSLAQLKSSGVIVA